MRLDSDGKLRCILMTPLSGSQTERIIHEACSQGVIQCSHSGESAHLKAIRNRLRICSLAACKFTESNAANAVEHHIDFSLFHRSPDVRTQTAAESRQTAAQFVERFCSISAVPCEITLNFTEFHFYQTKPSGQRVHYTVCKTFLLIIVCLQKKLSSFNFFL